MRSKISFQESDKMSSISFFKVPKDGNVEEIKKRVSAIIGDGDDDGIPIPMAVERALQKLKQESPNHKSYKQFREYAAYLTLVKSGKVDVIVDIFTKEMM